MAALASHISSVSQLVAKAQAGLFSDAYTNAEVEAFQSGVLKQSWMMTAALTINVSLISSFSKRYLRAEAGVRVGAYALGSDRRWHRVVARVCSLEELDRLLPRPPAHCPHIRYARCLDHQNGLTKFRFQGSD